MSVNPAKIHKDLTKFVSTSKLDNPAEIKIALEKSIAALSILLDKRDHKERQSRYVARTYILGTYAFLLKLRTFTRTPYPRTF